MQLLFGNIICIKNFGFKKIKIKNHIWNLTRQALATVVAEVVQPQARDCWSHGILGDGPLELRDLKRGDIEVTQS